MPVICLRIFQVVFVSEIDVKINFFAEILCVTLATLRKSEVT